jgi:hypothetical protein
MWTCCKCPEKFLYLWDTTRQCVNARCQHAYSENCCSAKLYPVRDEASRGTSSSSRRS